MPLVHLNWRPANSPAASLRECVMRHASECARVRVPTVPPWTSRAFEASREIIDIRFMPPTHRIVCSAAGFTHRSLRPDSSSGRRPRCGSRASSGLMAPDLARVGAERATAHQLRALAEAARHGSRYKSPPNCSTRSATVSSSKPTSSNCACAGTSPIG